MAARKDHIPVVTTPAEAMTAAEFAELGGRRLVYVRTVVARDVWDDLVDEDGDRLADVPEDTTLYSVHSADGERIALVGNRDLAFAAARQHEMNPVSVH